MNLYEIEWQAHERDHARVFVSASAVTPYIPEIHDKKQTKEKLLEATKEGVFDYEDKAEVRKFLEERGHDYDKLISSIKPEIHDGVRSSELDPETTVMPDKNWINNITKDESEEKECGCKTTKCLKHKSKQELMEEVQRLHNENLDLHTKLLRPFMCQTRQRII